MRKKTSSKYVKPGTLYGFNDTDDGVENLESGIAIQLSRGLNQSTETTYPNPNTAEFSVTALEEGSQEIRITYENGEPKSANVVVRPLPAKLVSIDPETVSVIEHDIFNLKFIFDKPLVDGQGYPIIHVDKDFEIVNHFTLGKDRSYGEMQIRSLISGTSQIKASLGGSTISVNIITLEHPAKLISGSLTKNKMDIYGDTELTLVFDKKPLINYLETTMSPGLEKIGEPTINPENELEVKINLKVIEIGNQRIDIEYKNEIQTFTMESKNPIERSDYVFESLEDLRNRIGDVVKENNYDLSEKVLELKFTDDINENIFEKTGIIKTPKSIIYPGKKLAALFRGCTELVDISRNLFYGCPNLENIYYIFSGCTKIESLPSDLFTENDNLLAVAQLVIGCKSLKSLPNGLFRNKFKCHEFSFMCQGCSSLEYIPYDLFDDVCQDIQEDAQYPYAFESTFNRCTELQSPLPPVWELFPQSQYSGGCYSGCDRAPNYLDVPKEWGGLNIEPDYYFETFEDFKDRIVGICEENGQDLSQKIFKFGDNVTELTPWYTVSQSYLSVFPSTITATPKTIIGKNIESAERLFYRNTNLTSISKDLLKYLPNIKKLGWLAIYASLTSIPENLFSYNLKLEDVSSAFWEVKIDEIPENLFKYNKNLKLIRGCFEGGNITSIPENLFANCPEITNIDTLFQKCSLLTSIPENLFINQSKIEIIRYAFFKTGIQNIPENLFANCPNIKNVYATFASCSELLSIPGKLFQNQHNIYNFREDENGELWLFNRAYKNKSIGEGIFDTFTKVDKFVGMFQFNYELETVPDTLFKKCINATSFDRVFNGCRSLKYVAEDLFSECTKANNFSSAFYNCYEYIGNLPRLWETHPNANGSDCFAGCTRAANYLDVPVEWGGVTVDYEFEDLIDAQAKIGDIVLEHSGDLSNVIMKFNTEKDLDGELFRNTNLIKTPKMIFYKGKKISRLFQGCDKLTTISPDLLAGCSNVEVIHFLFRDCTLLTAIPENLFRKNETLIKVSSCFYGCTALTTVPENLFNNKPKLKGFSNTFRDCTSLVTLPERLFEGVATDVDTSTGDYPYAFGSCFYGCVKLSKALPLWETFTNEDGIIDGCYENCTSASNYEEIPEEWK